MKYKNSNNSRIFEYKYTWQELEPDGYLNQ